MQIHSALPFIKAYLVSWIITYLLASIFHTQRVLHELAELDVVISLADRVSTTLDDIIGLLPKYGSAIALALFIAQLVAVIITRRRAHVAPWTCLAGAIAMLVMLLAMQPIMNVTLIAGAREVTGIALQCLAGAIGGLLFATLYGYFQSKQLSDA